jgi:hypothetical protein
MAGENTPIYFKQGGAELVIGAGGQLTISGGTVSGSTVALTASGAVASGVQSVELNHATVVIAATMVATEHKGLFVVKDTSATGTANHTLTLTGGTFDGTNTIATFNARDDFLAVFFDSAGRGSIVANVGSVALS